jgi:translation elongation factor aEF-1 beta
MEKLQSTATGKLVTNDKGSVSFPCPNCGEAIIVRTRKRARECGQVYLSKVRLHWTKLRWREWVRLLSRLRLCPRILRWISRLSRRRQKRKSTLSSAETAEKKVAIEPVAFGLKSLNITFVSDEEKGTTDEIESQIGEIEGVQSCEVTDVRRALG